jgi:predicted transcriptional regulator
MQTDCQLENLLDANNAGCEHADMKLTDWLKETGTTLTEFANEIGEDVSTCHNWMTGRRNPRAAALAKIDRATDGKVRPADFAPSAQAATV